MNIALNSGTTNSITLNSLLSQIKFDAGIDGEDTSYDIMFMRMLELCIFQHTDCASSMVKRQQLGMELNNNRVALPCGFRMPILIIPHYGDLSTQAIYVNVPIFSGAGVQYGQDNSLNVSPYENSYQIEDGYIWFHPQLSQTLDDNDVPIYTTPTSIDVYFWGTNVDKNGNAIVYDTYEPALTAFVLYRWFLRNSDPRYKEWKDTWYKERRTLKGNDYATQAQLNKPYIQALWNALAVSKTNYVW